MNEKLVLWRGYKTEKPLAKEKKREKTEIRHVSGDITTNPTEIKTVIWEYYELLDVNIWDILDKKDKFLKTQNLSRTSHEWIEYLNRSITSKESQSTTSKESQSVMKTSRLRKALHLIIPPVNSSKHY